MDTNNEHVTQLSYDDIEMKGISQLSIDYMNAMMKVYKIREKIEKLRAEGRYKSMKKVIDDEMLKASVGKNKVLNELLQGLDLLAEHRVRVTSK